MKGRTALVTGASAGIGAEIARELGARGFHLVLTARRSDRLEVLASEIKSKHDVEVLVIPADLADRDAPERLRDELRRRNVSVDVLVNNAGYGINNSFTKTDWTTQADFLQVLLTSVVHLTHLFLGPMKERGWGRILNVASVAGFIPERPGDLYCPVKTFVIRFSRAVDLELRSTGVSVTALCPGFTYTEFHDVMGTRDRVRRLPKWMWLDSATVARQGVDAMLQGKAVHVNGGWNRLVVFLSWLLPSGLIRALAPKGALQERGTSAP